MALCLSNVSGLKKRKGDDASGRVRLVDAAWVWTEPHSMRLKVGVFSFKFVGSCYRDFIWTSTNAVTFPMQLTTMSWQHL